MKPEGMSEERITYWQTWADEWVGHNADGVRELVAEVRRLRGALKVVGDEGLEINGRLLTENASIASKLAVATEALRWYADREKRSHYDPLHPENMGSPWVRARAALKSIEGGE